MSSAATAEVYNPPKGNMHHGRVYYDEVIKINRLNPPGCAGRVYYTLTLLCHGDRSKAVIFAKDSTLCELTNYSSRTLYKALDWLEANDILYRFKVNGKRHIKWGPRPLELVMPEQPSSVQLEIADPANPNRSTAQKPDKKKEEPILVSTDIPVYKGPLEQPPPKVDLVEYKLRLHVLEQSGLYMNDFAGRVARVHFAPRVTSTWLQAFVLEMKDKVPHEWRNPSKLLDYHFVESKANRKGIVVSSNSIASANRHLSHKRTDFALAEKNLRLVPLKTDEALRKKEEQIMKDARPVSKEAGMKILNEARKSLRMPHS